MTVIKLILTESLLSIKCMIKNQANRRCLFLLLRIISMDMIKACVLFALIIIPKSNI